MATDTAVRVGDYVQVSESTPFNIGGTIVGTDASSSLVVGDTETTTYLWDGEWVASVFDSGTGTSDDPFIISNVEQLKAFRNSVNGGTDYAGAYIKVSAMELDISDEGGAAWVPIGNGARTTTVTDETIAFAGNFDGNGVTIRGLSSSGYTPDSYSINSDNEFVYGFFGFLSGNASISNITIEEASIDVTSAGSYIGDSVAVLAGYACGNVTISNVTVSGKVAGNDAVAGILGRSYGATTEITGCTNGADVVSNRKAGGISAAIGKADVVTATITGCVNTGSVSGAEMSGGILGYAFDGKEYIIQDCSSSGAMGVNESYTSGNHYSGGIVALASNTKISILGCESTGNVSSPRIAGGILGTASGGGTFVIGDYTGESGDVKTKVTGNTIVGAYGAGGVIGYVAGGGEDNNHVESVSVSGATVSNVTVRSTDESNNGTEHSAGGIIGTAYYADKVTIGSSTVTGSTVESPWRVGGVIGNADSKGVYELNGVEVSGTSITATDPDNSYNYTGGLVGVVSNVGEVENVVTITGCSVSGIELTARENSIASTYSYAGKVAGAAIGMVYSCSVSISDMDGDGGYPLIAYFRSNNSPSTSSTTNQYENNVYTVTLNGVNAETAIEWMVGYNSSVNLKLTDTTLGGIVLNGGVLNISVEDVDGASSVGTLTAGASDAKLQEIYTSTYWVNVNIPAYIYIAEGTVLGADGYKDVSGEYMSTELNPTRDPDAANNPQPSNGNYFIRSNGHVQGKVATSMLSMGGETHIWEDNAWGKVVATVDDNNFISVSAAIAAASGGTVTLVTDVEEDVTVDSVTATLDLNGHSLTNLNGATITVSQGATLTITDGSAGKAGAVSSNNSQNAVHSSGTVNIQGGTFTGSVAADEGATIAISGGTFSVDVSDYAADGYVIVEQSDGTYAPVPCYTVTFTVDPDSIEVRVPRGDEITTVPEKFSEADYVWRDTDNKVYLVPFTPDGNLTLTGTAVSDNLTVAISVSGSALIGQSVTLTASVGEGVKVSTYAWTLDGVQISGEGESITVNESGTYAVVITDSDGAVATASTTLNFVLPTYTVTFVYNGTETSVRVTSGDTAKVPEFVVPDGFELVWTTGSGTVWNSSSSIRSDLILNGALRIAVPDISVEQEGTAYEGTTVTLSVAYEAVDGLRYAFLWSTGETTEVIEVSESGTYAVTVTVSCDGYDDVTATADLVVTFRPVAVTFEYDGTSQTVETVYGGTAAVPDFGVPDGFVIAWTVDGLPWDASAGFTADTAVVGELALDVPVVGIVQDGHTVTGITVTLTAEVEEHAGIGYSVLWSTGETTGSIGVSESGTYAVTVTAIADGMEPVTASDSVELTFGEFGFIDDSIIVYAGFGPYRPGLIGADGMEFSSSDGSVVSVDGNGKLTYTGGDLRRDTAVTITVTAQLDGQPLEDTYRMTVLAEHHDMVTGDGIHNPVVEQPAASEVRDIWNDYLRPEVSAGGLPQTSRSDWTVVDIFIPDEDGHVALGGTFTVPFDYFGVEGPEGNVFHIVHIVNDRVDILVEGVDFTVGDDGVTVTVDSFSPFAFYAETEPVTPDDPDTPVVPGGDDGSSTPSQPSHPGYDDDDEYVPPSGGTIIVTPGGSTTTTTTTDDDDMKVAIVACAAVGVLAALIAVFVWTDRKS